jgi:hypothetical protein
VRGAQRRSAAMSERNEALVAAARRDRQSVVAGYMGSHATPTAKATKA